MSSCRTYARAATTHGLSLERLETVSSIGGTRPTAPFNRARSDGNWRNRWRTLPPPSSKTGRLQRLSPKRTPLPKPRALVRFRPDDAAQQHNATHLGDLPLRVLVRGPPDSGDSEALQGAPAGADNHPGSAASGSVMTNVGQRRAPTRPRSSRPCDARARGRCRGRGRCRSHRGSCSRRPDRTFRRSSSAPPAIP